MTPCLRQYGTMHACMHYGQTWDYYKCILFDIDTVMHSYAYIAIHIYLKLYVLHNLKYLNRTGASIVVNSRSLLPLVFEKTIYNPFCFMKYYDPQLPPKDWNNHSNQV